jgi:hypothetical protein
MFAEMPRDNSTVDRFAAQATTSGFPAARNTAARETT